MLKEWRTDFSYRRKVIQFLKFQKFRIVTPLFNYLLHIGWQIAFKKHGFVCFWVDETQRFRMKRLTLDYLETIINKLFVLGIYCTFYNSVAPISIICKYRMIDMLHVHSDLMRATGFQLTFH